jgi:cytochrome oxidase Cu insertion factor (SCO1/SenC/PrrC family)
VLAQWILCGIALPGALGLALWFFRRLRRRRAGPETIMGVLSLCLVVACLVASAATAILDRLDEANKESLVNSPGPLTAADYNPRPAPTMPVNTPAPDFTLPRLDNGVPVHLADLLHQRPVVLIFGSFGCNYFCARLDQIRQLQKKYGDQAGFLFVYINNRHSEPEPLQAVMADADAPFDAPVNRLARIRAGMQYFDLPLTCVVDADDDRVQDAYDAFPARLVIVDQADKIAFDSGSIVSSGLNPEGADAWRERHTGPTKTP